MVQWESDKAWLYTHVDNLFLFLIKKKNPIMGSFSLFMYLKFYRTLLRKSIVLGSFG